MASAWQQVHRSIMRIQNKSWNDEVNKNVINNNLFKCSAWNIDVTNHKLCHSNIVIEHCCYFLYGQTNARRDTKHYNIWKLRKKEKKTFIRLFKRSMLEFFYSEKSEGWRTSDTMSVAVLSQTARLMFYMFSNLNGYEVPFTKTPTHTHMLTCMRTS